MNVLLARAQLFAAIEGGSIPWSKEILEFGPIEVRDRLINGDYSSAGKVRERLKQNSGEEVLAIFSIRSSRLLNNKKLKKRLKKI